MFEGLDEVGIVLNWIVGIFIGVLNMVIIVGNVFEYW